MRPIAIPLTMALIRTPAAMSDIQEAQMLAWEELPLLSVTSATQRMVYGNSSLEGMT